MAYMAAPAPTPCPWSPAASPTAFPFTCKTSPEAEKGGDTLHRQIFRNRSESTIAPIASPVYRVYHKRRKKSRRAEAIASAGEAVVDKMGRRPNPVIAEFFQRGNKLSDNSNR